MWIFFLLCVFFFLAGGGCIAFFLLCTGLSCEVWCLHSVLWEQVESTIFLEVEQAVVFSNSIYYFSVKHGWTPVGSRAARVQPAHPPCCVPQCQSRQREILDDVYLYCTFILEDVWMSHGCCMQWLRSSYAQFPLVLWSQLKEWKSVSICRDSVWVSTELA